MKKPLSPLNPKEFNLQNVTVCDDQIKLRGKWVYGTLDSFRLREHYKRSLEKNEIANSVIAPYDLQKIY
jgi:hypothetical protein